MKSVVLLVEYHIHQKFTDLGSAVLCSPYCPPLSIWLKIGISVVNFSVFMHVFPGLRSL